MSYQTVPWVIAVIAVALSVVAAVIAGSLYQRLDIATDALDQQEDALYRPKDGKLPPCSSCDMGYQSQCINGIVYTHKNTENFWSRTDTECVQRIHTMIRATNPDGGSDVQREVGP